MTTLERLVVELATDATEYNRGLSQAANKTSSWGGKLAGIAGKAAVGAMAAAGAAIAGVGAAGVKEFIGFQNGMNEVFTLLPGITAESMGQMQEQVKGFAREFGVLPKETVPALYQALSAGVPKDNVFEFLEVAQKAARGGVTDLETAVDGISSTVNAYGADVVSAARASDLMFTAVKLGKTTFDDLSRSLFNVNPTAAALGVQFGDVTAALAAMTAQGVPTSVATTQLRQLLVELSKAGTKTSDAFIALAGKDFQTFIAEGNNLQDALNLISGGLTETSSNAADAAKRTETIRRSMDRLQDRLAVARRRQSEFNDKTKESVKLANQQQIDRITQELSALQAELAGTTVETSTTTTKMSDLFGSVEAANAALALTGKGAESFSGALEEMGSSAGATDKAFEQMDSGISASLGKLQATWSTILIDIGEKAAPAFSALVSMAEKALPKAGEAVNKGLDFISGAIGTARQVWEDNWAGMRTSVEKFKTDIQPDLIRIQIRLRIAWEKIKAEMGNSGIDTEWESLWSRITRKTLEWARDTIKELEDTLADMRPLLNAGLALLQGDWDTFWDEFFKLEPQTLTFNGVPIYDWFDRNLLDPLRRVMETWRYLQSLRGDGEPTGVRYDTGDPTGYLPGYARGTNFARGGWALVGEEGPELVNLPRGSRVIPNHRLGLSGGGQTTINITINGARDEQAARNGVLSALRQAGVAFA